MTSRVVIDSLEPRRLLAADWIPDRGPEYGPFVVQSANVPMVSQFVLVNADTNQPLGAFSSGATIDLSTLPTGNLNVLAETTGSVASVRFGRNGEANVGTDNSAPFILAESGWTPSPGRQVLVASPFAGANASGQRGRGLAAFFTFTGTPKTPPPVQQPQPGVVSLTLINADTDQPIKTLVSGDTIDLEELATRNLNILANVNAETQSVWFGLDGNAQHRLESTAPFSLFGDQDGDYAPWTPSAGSHVITVTPYALGKAAGVAGTPLTVTFNVVDPVVTVGDVPDPIHLSWTSNPSTTVTAVWHTDDDDAPTTLEYRAVGSTAWQTAAGSLRRSGADGTLHEVTVTNLTPGTSYEYRARNGNAASAVYSFKTAPAAGGSFDFIYFADTGIVGRPDGLTVGTQNAINQMADLDPDFLLAGGDYAYYSTDNDRFDNIDEAIDAWFQQMQPLFANAQVMPTYGNHEVYLDESLDDWAPRFAVPDGIENDTSYSFDVAGVHFISLLTGLRDSQGIPNSRLTWLRNDLAAARARGVKWIIPFTHNAPFADGASHPSNIPLREQLGPVFEEFGVKVVLTSHDQSYERTYPLVGVPDDIEATDNAKTGYDENDGIVWVKVSPAGKLSNKSGNFSKFQHSTPPYPTAYRNDSRFFFSQIQITGNTLTLKAYGFTETSPAQVMDEFTYTLN